MPKITYIDTEGTARTVEAEVGSTVMETATTNDIPGILATCGGSCACATCHVYVDEAWFDRLPPAEVSLDPHRLIEEMHVLTPDRRRAFAGYSAFRWIAWRLPLTWLVAPFLYLPGVPWLGNRVYRWVAKNRFNLVPCDDGGCQVPLKK